MFCSSPNFLVQTNSRAEALATQAGTWDRGRDPFNQNFPRFRSKTQWIGSVHPEKFRKNWSAFWGGPGRFPFNKNSGLKFRKLHVLNGTVHSGCTNPTQATARFVIVASKDTHNYALKEKSKYFLNPKEHSTVEKGRWKTEGGGILFRVNLWMQVKV